MQKICPSLLKATDTAVNKFVRRKIMAKVQGIKRQRPKYLECLYVKRAALKG